jgi:uncharacterized protein (DUF2336 family)
VEKATNLENLIDLARENSSEGRRELLRGVTDLFFEAPEGLSEAEVEAFGGLLGDLVHDMEMEVRSGLAERLSESIDAPLNVVEMLANDELDVARPILENSPVLDSEALVRIVRQRSQEHKLVIALRKEIDPATSEALAEEGNDSVVEALVRNKGAELSERALDVVVQKSEHNERLHQPLVSRQDLPPVMLQQMFWWVSNTLRERILSITENIAPAELDKIFSDTGDAFSRNLEAEHDSSPAQKFVRRKAIMGQLNEPLLVELLRAGQVPEFIVAFAHLTELDIESTRKIVLDPGCEPLAVACKACGFDRSTFASVEMLTYTGPARSTGEVFELLEIYDRVAVQAAQRAIRFWRVRIKAAESETYWPPKGTDYSHTDFLKEASVGG